MAKGHVLCTGGALSVHVPVKEEVVFNQMMRYKGVKQAYCISCDDQ
jgi:hypothetical protein